MNKYYCVYNTSFSPFFLSEKALTLLNEKRRARDLPEIYDRYNIDNFLVRTDKDLVDVVLELGDEAGDNCILNICAIPDEYIHCYTIDTYDFMENIKFEKSKLIEHRLKNLNLNSMLIKDRLSFLSDLCSFVNS